MNGQSITNKQMASEVKLLGCWSIPFSRRVDLALRLKGVAYDYTEADVSKKSAALLEYNPIYQEVPVLVHNGKSIAGSLVIIEYIEDTWGGHPLLPKDPYEKAHARFLAKFIDDKCFPAFRALFWGDGDIQNSFERARDHLSIHEGELGDKGFFAGDDIGLADIAANYVAFWVGVLQEMAEIDMFNKENFPRLWKWSQVYLASDIVLESLPDRDRLLSYFRARKKAMSVAKMSAN